MSQPVKEIMIKPIAHRAGEYIAYYRDSFFGSTYSVCFPDTITGAVALHKFHAMIAGVLAKCTVEFVLSQVPMQFKSRALLDLLTEHDEQPAAERSVT
jgi:hypothetical protein